MKNKARFMVGSFVTVLCLGFLLGKMFGGSLWTALGGLLAAFCFMFVGMVLGQMRSQADAKAEAQAVREAAKAEAEAASLAFAEQAESVQREFEGLLTKVRREKVEMERMLGDARLSNEGVVRAVTNRVANRIMSKFVPDLGADTRRKLVFKEVDQILEEELTKEDVSELVTSSLEP